MLRLGTGCSASARASLPRHTPSIKIERTSEGWIALTATDLDCYATDAAKFGKQVGGDILANKKTFLLIKTLEVATDAQRRRIKELETAAPDEKITGMLQLFHDCGVDTWTQELKEHYRRAAYQSLEDIAVLSKRKEPLRLLVDYLLQRDH